MNILQARKKVAVVGAGLSGLAAAYFLSERFDVTLMDEKGVGGGASGVASGLLHPYPGEKGRRSWVADEALVVARHLIKLSEKAFGSPVAHQNGILRYGPILNPGPDVEKLGEDTYLIHSGITVFTNRYLEGLYQVCKERGTELIQDKISSVDTLSAYDHIVLAVGAGIRFFEEGRGLNLGYVKGQVLTCQLQKPLERSISAKVYTALTPNPNEYHVGATYERDVIDDIPCLEKAVRLLNPVYPVTDCRAGIRVTNRAHYFPIVHQASSNIWVVTALGSRGLLYHGLMGQKLREVLPGTHAS